MPSHAEAKKELKSYFFSNWKNGIVNGLPNSNPAYTPVAFTSRGISYEPQVYFRNIEKRESVAKDQHFVVFLNENVRTSQRSIAGARIDGATVKYETNGVGVIRLYLSKENYRSIEEDFLVAVCQEMFLGKSTQSIWFRNPTVKDLTETENYFRTEINFEYRFETHVSSSR